MAEILDLLVLEHRHPALPTETASHFRMAAAVCMQRHHSPPAAWTVRSDTSGDGMYEVTWEAPTAAAIRQCAEMNDAVTVAAYALALAAADQHLHMKGLRRAEHGSGSDYYLVPSDAEVPDDPELDLERDDLIRLEVSGIEDDDVQSLRERVRVKVRQVGERRHPVPGLAGVAGFRTAQVIFRAVTK